MKTSFYSFMVFLMLILASCQESGPVEYVKSSTEKELLINLYSKDIDNTYDIVGRLQAYNDSLSNNSQASINGGSSSTRDKLKRWLKISLADFKGRCEGAACGITLGSYLGGPYGAAIGVAILAPTFGAICSFEAAYPNESSVQTKYQKCIAAYIKMKEDGIEYSDFYPTLIDLQLPGDKQSLQNEGAMHNLILNNLVNESYSTTTLEEALENGTISQDEYKCLWNRSTRAMFNKFYKPAGAAQSFESYAATFDFGEKANAVIRLYEQAIQDCSTTYEDVEEISNRYLSEIYSTPEIELEEGQKDNLAGSICVLSSSVEYWKVFDAQEQQ